MSVTELIRVTELLKAQGEVGAVAALYSGWLQTNPDDPLAYAVLFNYSVVLSDIGDFERAKSCLEKAIALNPDFMPPYINLGRLLEREGQVGLAIQRWSSGTERLSQITGTNISHKCTALNQMARTLEGVSRDDVAEDTLRQSLEIDNSQREVIQHYIAARQRNCNWPIVAPLERASRSVLMKGMSPLSAAAYSDDPMFQLALAAHYSATDVGVPPLAFSAWPKAEPRSGRLRIGYLSSDLREHAIGHLMIEVFGLHDRSRVEVFAYYCGIPSQDGMHHAFRRDADHWRDISAVDDATAARQMVEDGLHILVDVNGYTRDGRTKLVSMRPAPIIVNWLGYPGTTGSPFHHYIVADDFIIPDRYEVFYSERVLRLPCYQPNNRNRVVAETVPTRAEAGLPEDGTVYCCFNGAHKITRFTFERWLSVLVQVEGSVLWLLGASEQVNARLKAHAAARGISPDRIVFAGKLANPHHLARYPLADLFLDCSPYGAHTTASDALYMGVPVLTFAGRCFASRVCGSLVRSAGLPELVATSHDDFVAKAVALGRDRAAVAALKQRLTEGRDTAVLFDMPLLVRRLEELYEIMWADRAAGLLPEPDLTGLQPYLDAGASFDHEQTDLQTLTDYSAFWHRRLSERCQLRAFPHDGRLFGQGPSEEISIG